MPYYRYIDRPPTEPISEQIEKYIEKTRERKMFTLENTPEEILEKEAESILGMDREEIIKEIEGYQVNPTSFVEYLIDRKLSIRERAFLEFSSMYSLPCIYPKQYKPLFFLENDIPYVSLRYLLGIHSLNDMNHISTIIDCSAPLMIVDDINHNLRLYDHEMVCGCMSIDKFIEELKLSGQWYILSPVKNKSGDLQPYKNIVYPWDDDKGLIEIHHRMEIKAEGDNRYGIYSKSGRNNRKRRKVVSE